MFAQTQSLTCVVILETLHTLVCEILNGVFESILGGFIRKELTARVTVAHSAVPFGFSPESPMELTRCFKTDEYLSCFKKKISFYKVMKQYTGRTNNIWHIYIKQCLIYIFSGKADFKLPLPPSRVRRTSES